MQCAIERIKKDLSERSERAISGMLCAPSLNQHRAIQPDK